MAGLTKPSRQTTGFLLRSEVVAGWPDLLVEGCTISSADAHLSIKLPLLRMDYLAKDILICLFDGKPNALDFHLKPEAMHFGVDGPDKDSVKFYVLQRNTDGSTSESKIDIPW